jgi:hypothetical protein
MAGFSSTGGSKFRLTLKELGIILCWMIAAILLDSVLSALFEDWREFTRRDNPGSTNARMWILFLLMWLPWQTIRYVRFWRRKQRENPEGFDHMLTIVPEFDDLEDDFPGGDPLDRFKRTDRPQSFIKSKDFN